MWRIHLTTFNICTVPLICFNRLKRASIEVKLVASSCQTRMRCACVSELACMCVWITFETSTYSFRAFSNKASGGLRHACINLSCSEKLCFRGALTRMHNTWVSDRVMKYVLLQWAPSLNDRSVAPLAQRGATILVNPPRVSYKVEMCKLCEKILSFTVAN